MKTPFRLFLVLLAGISLLVNGCSTTDDTVGKWQPFQGTVTYVPKFRGFWGIRARGVGKINPIELPKEFQIDDLKISGDLLLRPDYGSAKKWGKVAEVRNLQVVE